MLPHDLLLMTQMATHLDDISFNMQLSRVES